MMGWVPLLAPEFESYSPEAFVEYVKSLHKPYKPEVKVKIKKTKRSKNVSNAKPGQDTEEDRKTETDAGDLKA
jgi:hypothetical protein